MRKWEFSETPPANVIVADCIEKCKRFDGVYINSAGRIAAATQAEYIGKA